MDPVMMAIVGAVAGAVIAFVLLTIKNSAAQKSKEGEAQDILKKAQAEAEDLRKKAQNDAKNIVREERSQLENEMEKKKKHLTDFERGLTKKEVALEQKTEQIQKDQDRIKTKETDLEAKNQKLDAELKKNTEIQDELANKLTQVAGLTKEQAKAELIEAIEQEAKVDAAKRVKRVEEEANEESEKRAKRIVGIAIQRFAGEYVAEQTISSVEIADDGTQSIRIALSTINGISDEEISKIISARPYKDLADFYYRSGTSQPIIESMILTGAFDGLHAITKGGAINRRDLLLHFSDLIKSPTMPSALRSQMTLGFDAPAIEASGLPDLDSSEKVAHEVKRLGMDITHHMLEFYSHFLNSIGAIKSSDLLSVRSASTVLVAGVRVSIQTPPIRSGNRVIFLTLDDGHGCSDATFFSDVASDYLSTIYTSELVLLRGVTRRTGARGISIRASGIWDLRSAYEKWNTQRSTLAI
jgi:hypothetical protein